MNKIDKLGVLHLAMDIEAGNIDVDIALDVILEKYSDVNTLAFILDILDQNGYQEVINKFIIAKHNRLLHYNECIDHLEACLEL